MNITISLHMPQYLQQYLRSFLTKKGHGYYLSRANDIGKYINSLIDYPEGYAADSPDDVKICLPYHPGKLNPYARNFMKKENQQRLVDYLTATFDLEFNRWIMKAERMNLPYNRAYEVFFFAKQIDSEARNFDAVKKKDYRFRQKIENDFSQAMLQFVS